MVDASTLVTALCVLVSFVGVFFLYYLSQVSQQNEATEFRAKRRLEDVAYYLSKLEEQIEDVEAQLNKKIDLNETEARISLTVYDKAMIKIQKKSKTQGSRS